MSQKEIMLNLSNESASGKRKIAAETFDDYVFGEFRGIIGFLASVGQVVE